MAEYTPTTEQVEEHYIYDRYDNAEGTQVLEEAEAEFRRWLAVHEAAIRADEREKVLAEQEWEYAIRESGHSEPWSDVSEDRDWLMDDHDGWSMSSELVYRTKAGPWVRVEPVNESEPT